MLPDGKKLGKKPDCLSFGNIDECELWMREKKQREREEHDRRVAAGEICGCVGQGPCSPEPHRHKLRHKRGKLTTTACSNHVQSYLSTSWFEASMVCSMCCTNEPMDGDGICEQCAQNQGLLYDPPKTDAVRIKEEGYCINRDILHGCLTWTEPGENMCQHCKNYFEKAGAVLVPKQGQVHRPRIRTIQSATRPCNLTVGCTGSMHATVHRYTSSTPPELWWRCPVCKRDIIAEKTTAVHATSVIVGAED